MKIIEISDEEVKRGLSHQYDVNHAEDFYVKGYHKLCTKKIVELKSKEFLKIAKKLGYKKK